MRLRKFAGILALALTAAMLVTACEKTPSPEELVEKAKKKFGSATVVSQTEGKDENKVELKDELQGFSYWVSSKMESLSNDSSLGDLKEKGSNFFSALGSFIKEKTQGAVEDLCKKADISCEFSEVLDEKLPTLLTLKAETLEKAEPVLKACAELIQKLNLKNRLDGVRIQVQNAEHKTIGGIVLPDMKVLDADGMDALN